MSKEHRALLARENGAKSEGAATAAGLEKCQYAHRAEVRHYFHPGSVFEVGRVERRVRYHWELRRLDSNISKPWTNFAVTPPPTSTAKSATSTRTSLAVNETEVSVKRQSPPADQPKCR